MFQSIKVIFLVGFQNISYMVAFILEFCFFSGFLAMKYVVLHFFSFIYSFGITSVLVHYRSLITAFQYQGTVFFGQVRHRIFLLLSIYCLSVYFQFHSLFIVSIACQQQYAMISFLLNIIHAINCINDGVNTSC